MYRLQIEGWIRTLASSVSCEHGQEDTLLLSQRLSPFRNISGFQQTVSKGNLTKL